MQSSSGGRCGEAVSNLAVVLVTVVQLIFFTRYHEYIAWFTAGPDGTVTRQSMLTDSYFTWLPFPIAASTIVIALSAVMLVYDRYWFNQACWILFCICGIAVTAALVVIFPFDFSVLPSAKAADAVSKAVRAFFIFMPVFYAVIAIVQFVQLRRHLASQGNG
jgi:uncharacterized membrane protein